MQSPRYQEAVAQAPLVLSSKAQEKNLLQMCAKQVEESLDWFPFLLALVFRVANKNGIQI